MDEHAVDLDDLRSRVRGCLLAGAIGDALGAPVEFSSLEEIRRVHGSKGVTGFLPAYGLAGGAITDDTQMTLFTAEGLLRGWIRQSERGIPAHPPSVIRRAYFRWLHTQGMPWPDPEWPMEEEPGWLVRVDGLHHRRAPGTTCLSALAAGGLGEIGRPANDSKGCGGVMRVAPVGLVDVSDPFRVAVETAAITHGHPSGYLAAGFLGELVARLRGGASLVDAIGETRLVLTSYEDYEEVLHAVDAAVGLAGRGRPSAEQLETLGGGWVAEEALAIALCCALVAEDTLDGLLLAVNHSGDSDSTGAITGNILGIIEGEAALPAEMLDWLELREVITQLADDLVDAFWGEGIGDAWGYDDTFKRWLERYPGF